VLLFRISDLFAPVLVRSDLLDARQSTPDRSFAPQKWLS